MKNLALITFIIFVLFNIIGLIIDYRTMKTNKVLLDKLNEKISNIETKVQTVQTNQTTWGKT